MHNIFMENKYTKWYFSIINKRGRVNKDEFMETHHIIPKSLGGSNKKDNLVYLSYREHFLVHWLLTKMCINNEHTIKMIYALVRMRGNRPITSWQFDMMKKIQIEKMRGANHPGYGKSRSQESRNKISNALKGKSRSDAVKKNRSEYMLSDKNPSLGKKGSDHWQYGNTHSEETKMKIKNANTGVPKSADHRDKLKQPKTEEHKRKLSAAAKNRNISLESKEKATEKRLTTMRLKGLIK